MGQEIVYCGRCQSRITSADLESGKAVRTPEVTCCRGCLTSEERAKLEAPAMRPASTRRLAPATARAVVEPPPRKFPLGWVAGGAGGLLVVVGIVVALTSGGKPEPPPTPPPAEVARPAAPKPPAPAVVEDPLARQVESLRAELEAPLQKNDFRLAETLLERARGRHDSPEWERSVGALSRVLMDRARQRVKELQGGDRAQARGEIGRWGPSFQAFLMDFEEPEATKPPAPAATPPPPPPPPAPKRSEAAQRYFEGWRKAMFSATRHDYARAADDLRAAGRGVTDEEVKKEAAADLQDLEKLQALHAEIVKRLAALPAWEPVELEVFQEDGSRAAVKGQVLQPGPQRLELRAEPWFVEYDEIAGSSLAKVGSGGDARARAILAALGGEAGAGLPEKYAEYAASVREKLPPPDAAQRNERGARSLFHAAEREFRALETRGAAVEKFQRLATEYAETAFVRKNGTAVAARIAEPKETVCAGYRLEGRGVFAAQKLQVGKKEKVETLAWVSRDEPASDDIGNYVEVRFLALPGVEYRGWALIGGCCALTHDWYLQGSDLTQVDRKTRKPVACEPGGSLAASWDHKLRFPSTPHGGKDHSKAAKEPSQWEWVALPLPKYAAGGVKTLRFLPASKGMAVAAVVVSALRDKRPADEELKKFAEAAGEVEVPTSALRCGKGEPDLLGQIPEARPYVLVYDLDLGKLKRPVPYDLDQRSSVKGPFDRVAYLLELQQTGKPGQYVFVSMDAFTDDPGKVGIPDGATFQQKVTSMNVHSNVEGLATGQRLEGNIEFWPNNYGPGNAAGVAGASAAVYDFGDQKTNPEVGYGSMQVHHTKVSQTVFAINHWSQGAGADLGIGNSTVKNPDWTFNGNAGSYSFKRLRVLVRPR